MRLARYIGMRLLLMVPVLFGVVTLTFLLIRVLPGDPAQAFVSQGMTAEDVQAIRVRLGLDLPIWQQYLVYLGQLATFNLGTSLHSGAPVSTELATRVGPTLELVFLSVAVAVVISVYLGIRSAMSVNSPIDHVSRYGSLVGTALPEFWLGLILIVIGYQQLHWFPAPTGRIDSGITVTPLTGAEVIDALLTGNIPGLLSALAHLLLPLLTIVIGISASLVRSVRAIAIEILAAAPWKTAVSHGVTGSVLRRGYLVRGTLSRMPSLIALILGNTLGGVVLVEYVFSWQGMGQWLLRGLEYRDYPVIQAGVLVIAVIYALAYLVADIAQALLDPRVRL